MMIHDNGIILRLHPLGEHGSIVVVSTASHGVIHLAARSARKPKSAFSGMLDLLYHVELSWKLGKSSLAILEQVHMIDTREAIRHDYPRLVLAAYFIKVFEASVEENAPEPALHDLLVRALNHLTHTPASLRALQHFEKELVRLHGLTSPEISAEQSLRQELGGRLPKQRETALRLLT